MLLKGLIVYVGEVHIVELHAAQLFQLLLHTTAHFERNLDDFLQFFLGKLPIRIEQLQIAIHHTAHGDGITLVQVLAQTEVMVERIAVLFLAQFPDELCQIIADKAIVIREMLRAELRNLPAGEIAVHTVEKCRVGAHFWRERVKQAGRFQQHVHALIDITDKDHRGRCSLFFFAASERTGGHVVLHDLHAVFILETNTGHLIKGNTIP